VYGAERGVYRLAIPRVPLEPEKSLVNSDEIVATLGEKELGVAGGVFH
jgi:hypothetical protein